MNPTLAKELFPLEDIRLCSRMSSFAYDGVTAFSNFKILEYSEIEGVGRPFWFCLKSGNDIYVVIRGTNSMRDLVTDLNFIQVKAEIFGVNIVFHLGFYVSARHIYNSIEHHLLSSTGKIIFTGHSFGGSVASILCIYAKLNPRLTDRCIRAYCYGPAPSSSYHNPEIEKCIAAFINEDDIVPTLTPKNAKLIPAPVKKFFNRMCGVEKELITAQFKIADILTPNGTKINDFCKYCLSTIKDPVFESVLYFPEADEFLISRPNGTLFFLSAKGSTLYASIVRDHEKLHKIAGNRANHQIELYDNIIFDEI